jgi:hypothetical protein
MWKQWLTGILGFWVLISPFLGFDVSGMTTNLVIVGAVTAILGFWSAVDVQQYREHEHQHA